LYGSTSTVGILKNCI